MTSVARSGNEVRTADVVVVGAGALGAACAYFLSAAGVRVHVVERGQIASGTTSAGEGNLLVSDKQAGPELDLARYSAAIWNSDLADAGPLWEYDRKGGFVVASTPDGADALRRLGARQRAAGIEVVDVTAEDITDYEPHLRAGLAAAAFYPQDAQLQPMLMTAHLLRLARTMGATVATGVTVTGFDRDVRDVRGHDRGQPARVTGLRTTRGRIACDHVVNAAGTWAGELAELAGVNVPVLPRRGFVLVTEPLPPTIRHKVYAGEYVAATQSADESLQTSTVIEGTRAGTILIGSSRERVGYDRTVSLPAMRTLAAEALALFPALAQTRVMRSYLGFRPYCPGPPSGDRSRPASARVVARHRSRGSRHRVVGGLGEAAGAGPHRAGLRPGSLTVRPRPLRQAVRPWRRLKPRRAAPSG